MPGSEAGHDELEPKSVRVRLLVSCREGGRRIRQATGMQVGYLGVGNMGQPMAAKLLDGGHSLVVFDISEAAMEPLLLRQARRAGSPKEIGDQCEVDAACCEGEGTCIGGFCSIMPG